MAGSHWYLNVNATSSAEKALPSDHHVEYMSLSDDDRRLVRRLGALLRLADSLDLDHFQLVEGVRLVGGGGTLTLELQARDEPQMALWAAERLSDLFELEFRRRVRPSVVLVA